MSRAGQQGFAAPGIDPIVLRGGLDQITPTVSLGSGVLRQALNFECAVSGGYTRIVGYERFDGHPSPAESSESGLHRYISVPLYAVVPLVGDALTASGGATGVLAYIDGLVMVVTKVSGIWAIGETLSNGSGLIGTVDNVYNVPASAEQDAMARNAVADIYRAGISAVPGYGPIRGVAEFNDTVFAFRDTVSRTGLGLYKSTPAGWVLVPMCETISFTAGGTAEPVDGATLTQGGVTALIKRVVRTASDWAAGTASGQFIIATPVGGHFAAGAATIGATNVTLAGAESLITLLPGGRFEFDERNFAGQAVTTRLYGCDGKNKAFEFDGDILVPITTGAAVDTPSHIAAHKGYLFLALGSSIMNSAPGLPYDWTALSGAAEIATGDIVTDIISMPGDANSTSLGIFNRNNTLILYQRALYDGSFSNWTLVSYNTGVGSVPFSAQNMAQTFMLDDRGVNSMQSTLQYGNFAQSTLTNAVLPFINERIDKCIASTLCRRKSQYRVFFNDGSGLYITVANAKLMGSMPVLFPDVVTCTYEGKKSDGTDVMYFGSDNGMVYQMEKGTSFDGAPIDFFFTTNYSNAKSPRTLKRYRKAATELTAETGCYASFDFATILGYDSAEYSQASNTEYSQYTGQTRWDSFTWDNFFWDANRLQPIECELEGTAENIALLISGSSDYVSSFTINSFLVHYSPRRMMR